jgi:putative oxidoreductase
VPGTGSVDDSFIVQPSFRRLLTVTRALPAPARDVVLLLVRILLAVVLIAHGWQKLVTNGVGATAEGFAQMGIPLAPVSALFAVVVEVLGGLLLLVGALTPVVGLLVVLNMLGAAFFAHLGNGVFVGNGGWELTGVIAAVALALAAAGAGRFSVDHLITARRREPVPA